MTRALRRAAAFVGLVALVAGCSPATVTPSAPSRADQRSAMPSPATTTPSPNRAAAPSAVAVTPSAPPGSASPAPPESTVTQPRILGDRAVSPTPRSVADRAWEPVVATHPTDPDRIAVVYVRRGPGAACSINPVIRISRDGGRSWRSTPSSPGSRSSRGMGLHAALAWGIGPRGKARLYWANMTTPGCGTGGFSLTTSYSDDEGQSWSPLHVERATPPWVGGFPELAVDRDPGSPNHGTVYVGYNWLGGGARGPGFRLLASSDFGRTWRRVEVPPVRLAAGAHEWWRIAYRLRPAPDGTVYASWYQVDMRHRDRTNIFAKGGPGNVQRLGVAVARIRFDRLTGRFRVGPARIAVRVRETAWTTSGASASGTGGDIRPDPIWQYGIDVDRTGGIHVAVGGYGASRGGSARGTIRVGRSVDLGRTWSVSMLPGAGRLAGHVQSSLRPNLVAGPGFLIITMRLLDDDARVATMGTGFAISSDGGLNWTRPRPTSDVRWRTTNLDGVTNGVGLRERAELTADGDVIWTFGDGRLARSGKGGRTAIFATRIAVAQS